MRVTISDTAHTASSTSAREVSREREKRTAPCIRHAGTCMARRTCDGCIEPDLQADPSDTAMPARLRRWAIASPSRWSKAILVVFAKRLRMSPSTTHSPLRKIPCSRRSRNAPMRMRSGSSRSAASSAAFPSPTIPGIFSVPARRPRSCDPPQISGWNFVPLRKYNAPTPFGPCSLCADSESMSIVLSFRFKRTLPMACTASV
ncbi:hypothetical protein IQ17_06983 [Bradyrhizobium daqingense]|uniref:Uncharacterized protein n=2 Tax=Bradyrhizobium TaxID=374 RepID=A0A562QLX6_9BRAD|nr:hypothetical protein IQ17_06983 [Bradyrhizobium daqingense]TWI57729.1 hypothetical protein IQ16_08288 [Bradyrhizobium huanghuaihaiense]